jgi:hypothetical protein
VTGRSVGVLGTGRRVRRCFRRCFRRRVRRCVRAPLVRPGTGRGEERAVPYGDRAAHREADRRDPLVPEGAGPAHRRREVEDLQIADRRVAARTSVPTEGEGDHGPVLREHLRGPPQSRPVHRTAEAVRQHDRPRGPGAAAAARALRGALVRVVRGLDPDPVGGPEHGPPRPGPWAAAVTRGACAGTGASELTLRIFTHVGYSPLSEGSGQRRPRVLLCFPERFVL